MGKVRTKAGLIRITLHNDKNTPEEFVVDLLCLDLRRPFADALRRSMRPPNTGKLFAGPIPAISAPRCLKPLKNALRLRATGFSSPAMKLRTRVKHQTGNASSVADFPTRTCSR